MNNNVVIMNINDEKYNENNGVMKIWKLMMKKWKWN